MTTCLPQHACPNMEKHTWAMYTFLTLTPQEGGAPGNSSGVAASSSSGRAWHCTQYHVASHSPRIHFCSRSSCGGASFEASHPATPELSPLWNHQQQQRELPNLEVPKATFPRCARQATPRLRFDYFHARQAIPTTADHIRDRDSKSRGDLG